MPGVQTCAFAFLISFPAGEGRPQITERCNVIAPDSALGTLEPAVRRAASAGSVIYGHYEKAVDRESAYELLKASAATKAAVEAGRAAAKEVGGEDTGSVVSDILFGATGPRGGKRDGLVQIAAKTVTRTIGSSLGRQIVRGILGSLLGGKR